MNISIDSALSEEDFNGAGRRSNSPSSPHKDGYDSSSFSSGGGQGSMSGSSAASREDPEEEEGSELEEEEVVVGHGQTVTPSPQRQTQQKLAATKDTNTNTTPQQYFHTPLNEDDGNNSNLVKGKAAAAASAAEETETWQLHLPDIQTLSPPAEPMEQTHPPSRARGSRSTSPTSPPYAPITVGVNNDDHDSYMTDDSDSQISYFNAKGEGSLRSIQGSGAGGAGGGDSVMSEDNFSAFTDAFEDHDQDSMISYDDDDAGEEKKKRIKPIQSVDTLDFSGDKSDAAGTGDDTDENLNSPMVDRIAYGMGVVQSLKNMINPSRLFFGMGNEDEDQNTDGTSPKNSNNDGNDKDEDDSKPTAVEQDEEAFLPDLENEATSEPTGPDNDIKTRSTSIRAKSMRVDSMSASQGPPNLARAWAYFEHHMLPRHLIQERGEKRAEGNPIHFVEEDVRSEMTRGRRIALKLSKYSWYYKGKELTEEEMGLDEKPDPKKTDENNNDDVDAVDASSSKAEKDPKVLESAVPGEDMYETQLYSIFNTPLSQMGDFGLGVGLYFVTLRAIMILTFVCGCVSIYNMVYFASDAYNGTEGEDGYNFNGEKSVPWYLRGTAVCTRHEWVICNTCKPDDFKEDEKYRIRSNEDGTVMFALKNRCEGTIFRVGMVTFSTIVITAMGLVLTYWWLRRMEVKFDEDEQTAQDYSIVIRNPPRNNAEGGGEQNGEEEEDGRSGSNICNVYDPNEWSNFFETKFPGSHVTCCTVVVDNDDLLQALVQRREIIKLLDDALDFMEVQDYKNLDFDVGGDENGDGDDANLPNPIRFKDRGIDVDMNELEEVVEHIERKRNMLQQFLAKNVSICAGIPELYYQLVDLQAEIVKLAKDNYPISSVFVTFETEKHQRQVLDKMAVSQSLLQKSKKHGVGVYPHPELLFQGNRILDVHEPAEPSTIRWADQDISMKNSIFKSVLTLFVLILVVTPIFVIDILSIPIKYVSWYIAVSNASFPSIAKIICMKEKHKSEDDRQVSLFIKIGVFRIVNTVLLVEAISLYSNTIMYGDKYLLSGVYKIFFAEIVTATALQYLDIGANIQRHIMAPRAKTQEKMNLSMRGSQIFLAERYTNMSKLFFMAVWYAPIYPFVLFMCSIALFINFYMDKFSIMRSWRRSPLIGRSIGRFTRQIVFPLIVAVMAFQGFRSWSNFPYDKLCENGTAGAALTLSYEVMDVPPNISNTTNSIVEIGPDTPTYEMCFHDQDWRKNGRDSLDDHSKLNKIYERTFIAIVTIAAGSVLLVLINYAKRYWKSSYERIGKDKEKPYGEVKSITAYIPEWKTENFAFPFLVCPTGSIEKCDLFNWEDPDREYGFYDVTRDARQVLEDAGEDDFDLRQVFSQMVYNKYTQD